MDTRIKMTSNLGEHIQGVRSTVACTAEDETMVALSERDSVNRDSVCGSGEAGAQLWSSLGRGRGVSELAAWLKAQYGLSAVEATADAIEFVAGLAEEGLIRRE